MAHETDDDGTGRCRICGNVADHKHTGDEATGPDDVVLEVELAPEMIAAMTEAGEKDVALELADPDEAGDG